MAEGGPERDAHAGAGEEAGADVSAGAAAGLPEAVRALRGRVVAAAPDAQVLCLRLDLAYRVREIHGDPSRFGLGDLTPGMDARTWAPYLDHFVAGERLLVPMVNIGNDRTVHLHVVPLPELGSVDGGWYVLFAPAERERAEQARRQQQDNEARIQAGRLQGRLLLAAAEGQLWRDQAEEARMATWRLAGSLSHELKTPLNAIVGYCRLLQERLAAQPEGLREIMAIERSAGHIHRLVDATLDQYRTDAFGITIHRQPTDLRRLVSELTELMAPLAADRGLGFAAFVSPELPARLALDGMRIRQVLLNLLGNAVKFTDDGWVRLDVTWADGSLALTVADSGPGIAPEYQERVFAPFDRGGRDGEAAVNPPVGTRDGSGLGLHITREVVTAMGGSVRLESQPGRGSRFRVDVPAEAVEVVEAGGEAVAPGRLLVAEDDGSLQALLGVFLERAGFSAHFVTRGDELERAVTARPPQLCLMDLNLADSVSREDGLAVARRLREAGYHGPLVAMSAGDAGHLAPAAARAGCDAFIAKPVRPDVVVERLLEVLRERAGGCGQLPLGEQDRCQP